jgi:hypothetical protein
MTLLTDTACIFLSNQVLTVIPGVSLESGRKSPSSFRGVMGIRGQNEQDHHTQLHIMVPLVILTLYCMVYLLQ